MFTTLMLVALAGPVADPTDLSEAAKKELKKLEGKWKVTKEITSTGENERPLLGGGCEVFVEFKGSKMLLGGKETFEFEVSALDPGVDPKILDIKNLVEIGPIPKGAVVEAIYKLDGDTLTLVGYAGADKKRPANFDPPKDENVGMWIMKRVKD